MPLLTKLALPSDSGRTACQKSPAFRLRKKSRAGFAVAEILVAIGLILLISVSSTHALLTTNRIAARNRVMTAARAVVQRNVDSALSVAWKNEDSASDEHPIIRITSSAGESYDDDGTITGETPGQVKLIILKNGVGETVILQGILRRIVTAVPNIEGADIRRVTFRLTYTFERKDYVVEMTSFRTVDD